MNQPGPSSSKKTRRQIAYGFGSALLVFAVPYAIPSRDGNGPIMAMILGLSLIPFSAIVLAIIPATRKFGLGLLLGCGAIWLIMLAICGGLRIAG